MDLVILFILISTDHKDPQSLVCLFLTYHYICTIIVKKTQTAIDVLK